MKEYKINHKKRISPQSAQRILFSLVKNYKETTRLHEINTRKIRNNSISFNPE